MNSTFLDVLMKPNLWSFSLLPAASVLWYLFVSVGLLMMAGVSLRAQAPPPTPSGDPKDFRIRPCLHSIGYGGVWRGQAQLTVDQFLLKAKELGFDSVMLMAKRPHVSPLDYDDAARKRLKARLNELGLTLVGLAGYSDFTAGIDKPGIPNVEIQAAYVGEVAKLARDLGCSMVRIFTGYERPGIPYDRQYATVVEGLKLAGQEAAKYGVTLAVQNHHDIALHHDSMRWLIEEVNLPNVKVGWDAWSPTLEGLSREEIRNSVLKLKPYIVNTIAAQYKRQPRFRYVNELTNYQPQEAVMRATSMTDPDGVIDYTNFIGALKEIGYRGYVVYEMCEVLEGGGSIENLDKTARECLKFFATVQTAP